MEFTGERMIPESSDRTTFWEHIYRYRFAVPFVKNARVLDIACGEGYGAAALLEAGARSVIGIDISEESCEHVRRKYGLDARQGSAEAIPLPDCSVDVVVSFETIEHVRRPAAFVDECTRLLRSDGTLIMSTPVRDIYRASGRDGSFHCSEMPEEEFAGLLEHRFGECRYYTQQPTRAWWWTSRPLCLPTSPWLHLPGSRRLHRMITDANCPHITGDVSLEDRQLAVKLISARDGWLASTVNPYSVIRRLPCANERPVYLIVLARRPRRL
jgi:SAM-dependent methyltransferase